MATKKSLKKSASNAGRSRVKESARQIKQTTKQINATKRTLKRASKSTRAAEELELEQIEKLLDDTFKTLAEARRELARQTEQVIERATKPEKKQAPKTDFDFGANVKPPRGTHRAGGVDYVPAKPTQQRFNPKIASRNDKFRYAQKIGKKAYYKRVTDWWENHPDDDLDDNPYTYHSKE